MSTTLTEYTALPSGDKAQTLEPQTDAGMTDADKAFNNWAKFFTDNINTLDADCLKKAGGTMTGAIVFAPDVWNTSGGANRLYFVTSGSTKYGSGADHIWLDESGSTSMTLHKSAGNHNLESNQFAVLLNFEGFNSTTVNGPIFMNNVQGGSLAGVETYGYYVLARTTSCDPATRIDNDGSFTFYGPSVFVTGNLSSTNWSLTAPGTLTLSGAAASPNYSAGLYLTDGAALVPASLPVSMLPATDPASAHVTYGAVYLASDGCKTGESTGMGTGVMVVAMQDGPYGHGWYTDMGNGPLVSS